MKKEAFEPRTQNGAYVVMEQRVHTFEEISPIVNALEDKHAEDVLALDLRQSTAIADYFILATANSTTHLQTLQEAIEDAFELQNMPYRREGDASVKWRVVDGGHVVVHLFSRIGREFYRLERIWGDAPSKRFSISSEDSL